MTILNVQTPSEQIAWTRAAKFLRALLAAVVILCLLAAGLHWILVRKFVNDVKQYFSDDPADVRLIESAGYPDGFIKAKVAAGKIRSREDARSLMTGFDRSESLECRDYIADSYVFRVGMIPIDYPVVFTFDRQGRFTGVPIDGLSWR